MLTTVRGIYENGQITLEEPLATQHARVIVTVLEEIRDDLPKRKRPFGISKGSIQLNDDFNEPIDDLKDYM